MIGVRIALLCAGLAACASKHEPQTHQIEIRGMKFVPAELVVSVGDTIVWTNRDVLPHTVTGADFNSLSIAAQQQWMYTVMSKGTIRYTCTFHPTMNAALIVK
jgi:plastocyanin